VLDVDGHDFEDIERALHAARAERSRPTLIIGRTTIGKGSPHMAGNSESHGSPLGAEEVKATKRALGMPEDRDFYIPEEVTAAFAARRAELRKEHENWQARMQAHAKAHPELADQFRKGQDGFVPGDLAERLPVFPSDKPMATRSASGRVLQELARAMPHLIGGSADLAPSTSTLLKDGGSVGPHRYGGRNLHYGIREHGMAALVNGMCLHKGFHVYGATFLVFSDYCRPSLRLAAIMEIPAITVFTHDSVFLGEDGPTHQAVEHLAALRAIPHMTVIRPGDANETAHAWLAALRHRRGPTLLVLSRQNMPVLDRKDLAPASRVEQGAYVLWESDATPRIILIGTGSELHLALEAGRTLAAEGVAVRVVSMPSWELFERQPAEVRDAVLPPSCTCRVAVEAGIAQGWARYVGTKGRTVTLDRYGASAPYTVLAEQFGFTVANVLRVAREALGDSGAA
jgi:transketolase